MGRLAAEDMIEQGGKDLALEWHLRSNHFPPIDLSLLPVAKEAISLADGGDWETEIDLPPGLPYAKASVSKIVSGLHLAMFVQPEEEDYDLEPYDDTCPDCGFDMGYCTC